MQWCLCVYTLLRRLPCLANRNLQEPAIKPWLEEQDEDKKRDAPLTDDMRFALDRFYFNHYCKVTFGCYESKCT